MTNSLTEFLHVLSRFRSAYPPDTAFEWQSRHFYEISEILSHQLTAIGLKPNAQLYIADQKVVYITVQIEGIEIDLLGKNAKSRFFESYYEDDIPVSFSSVQFNDVHAVLLDHNFFHDNWALPTELETILVSGLSFAAQDFALPHQLSGCK
jgi:hypothetical protein